MCKKTRSPSPWLDLPSDILHKIIVSTKNPLYELYFRAVCTSWRSSLPQTKSRGLKNMPLKLPHHPSFMFGWYEVIRKTSFFVVPTTTYVVQPKNGSFKGSSFLVTADELNPGRLSLRYPLSASHRGALGLGNSSSESLNLLENVVFVLDQGFSLRLLDVRGGNACGKDEGGDNGVIGLNRNCRGEAEKVVILRNPCCEEDLLVLVLFRRGKLMALRVRDEEWKVVFDGNASKCADIVKFKEEVYGIDLQGRAFLVDYDFEEGVLNIVTVVEGVVGTNGKRLVVDSSSGKVYMVVRVTHSSELKFVVYRLNAYGGVWKRVRSIGNRMFFIGVNFSFCASERDFPGLSVSCIHSLPRNCIFFGKGSFLGGGYGEDGDRFLFGTRKEGTGMNSGQYYLGDHCATGLLEAAYDIMFSPPF